MKKQLHPGAKWQFRLRAYFGILFPLIIMSIWAGLAITAAYSMVSSSNNFVPALIIPIFFLLAIGAILIIGEIYARMAYTRWFYEFTNSNLKLERGIIWKRYSNIPYERVQNVDITRGIIARILGFSSVNIQTAGYSMPMNHRYGGQTEGYIPAVNVEEAEKIRDFLMSKIAKRLRNQGL